MSVIIKQDSGSEVTLTIKRRPARYIDEFITLKCAPDLLADDLFPNAKEITESMMAFHAVKRTVGAPLFADESVRLYDVGAGHRPRTAALFACMTRWRTVAIDPAMSPKGTKIRRVEQQRVSIQDYRDTLGGLAVIVAVHAHVKLSDCLDAISAPRRIVVAMPCCQPLELSRPPDREYLDHFCWSPERTVKIWDMR